MPLMRDVTPAATAIRLDFAGNGVNREAAQGLKDISDKFAGYSLERIRAGMKHMDSSQALPIELSAGQTYGPSALQGGASPDNPGRSL